MPTVRGKTYDLERDFGAVPYDPTQPETAMNKTAVRSSSLPPLASLHRLRRPAASRHVALENVRLAPPAAPRTHTSVPVHAAPSG
jgi:hypothetical protein